MLQHIRVEGNARQRGEQYGRSAPTLIQRSIAAYRASFQHFAGWDWQKVRIEARRFRAVIEQFDSRYLDEIAGIAHGAGVDTDDVLAINVRTEVLSTARARAAVDTTKIPHECSACAVLPTRSANGHTLMGQNWDWRLHAAETMIVLEVRQDDGPDFVTLVEAGLLAKIGMNSSGVAYLTNALLTEADQGELGVPYHVLLRAVLDAETVSDALAALLRQRRASSANFILGHEDGLIIDFETAPGDYTQVCEVYPQDAIVLHTNHFTSPRFDGRDVSIWALPHSPFRLERLRQLVAAEPGQLSVEWFQRTLADHANYPVSVCCHADGRSLEIEKAGTLASIIMDIEDRRIWIADGTPCTSEFVELDYGAFLSKPSPLKRQAQEPRPGAPSSIAPAFAPGSVAT